MAEPEKLANYAEQCLSQPLQKGGQILQDIVTSLAGGWGTTSRMADTEE
jgi:hypothetical protein